MASSSSADGARPRRRLRPAPRARRRSTASACGSAASRCAATRDFDGRASRRLRLRLRRDASPARSSTAVRVRAARRRRARPATSRRTRRSTAIEGSLPDVLPDAGARRRSTSCCACRCSSTCGSRERCSARAAPRDCARAASCSSTCRRGAASASLELVGVPARRQPGRGDGRPQALLRPARPLADAGAGRLPAERHPLPPAQVRPQHVRRLPRPAGGDPHDALRRRATSTRPRGSSPTLDRDAIEAVASGLAAVRDGGGRLFILGVGGSAGHAEPRGQRLPQAVRLRGLRADRQRLRAHRAHQRRGLGHDVRGLAARARASAPATRCWSSRSAAATPSANVSRNLVARARARAARSARGVYGDRRPRRRLHGARRRRVRGHPAAGRPSASRPTPRACARSSGTCWSATRRCRRRRPSGSRWRGERRRERAVIIVGGAGFIGSHFTDALLADERTERVTLYDNFSSGPRVALRRTTTTTRAWTSCGATSTTSTR